MPPKAKITKEMILDTVLDITREAGFGCVNARSISSRLRCSTRPVFTCFENMDELKREFLEYAYEFYSQYVGEFGGTELINPCLVLPVSYIEFAKEEPNLFRFLFISHMDLSMAEPGDFYREAGNEKRERIFSDAIGIEPERAREIFLDLFLYSHGIAVLAAAQKITLDRTRIEKMAANMLTALIRQEKPDWTLFPQGTSELIL